MPTLVHSMTGVSRAEKTVPVALGTRGYDVLIGPGLLQEAGRLVKVRPTAAQTSLEARARETNLKGAFQVRKNAGLKGKVVILVDDVYTTGSTIRECSRVLRKAGVKEVRAVTVAQA